MDNTKFSKMSFGDAWEIPWKCWELMKVNYMLALGVGFIMFMSTLVGIIPFVGQIIADPLLLIITMGSMYLAKDWEKGQESSLETFTGKALDSELLGKVTPLLIILAVFAAINIGATHSAAIIPFGSAISTIVNVLSNFAKSIIFLAAALLIFNKETDFQAALDRSLKAVISNILPVIFLGLIYIAIAFLCMIVLFLPVFFIFFPLSVSSSYLLYRVLFDGLQLTEPDGEKEDLFI